MTDGDGKITLTTVKNVGGSVVDVDDGRSFGPGECLDDVNLQHPHNDRLVLAGLIRAVPVEEAVPSEPVPEPALPEPPADDAPKEN